MTDDTNPLSRWSQRKLAARRGEPDDEDGAVSPVETPDEPSVAKATDGDAEVEAEAPSLPPIESLDASSDYTAFMAKNVPEALKRAALRKLWTSDPVLANLDGLNNYDEDYNIVDQAITLAQTSYRPGLGYFEEIEKKVEEAGDRLERVEEALRRVDEQPVRDTVESGEQPDQRAALSNNDAPEDNLSNAPQEGETSTANGVTGEPSGQAGKSG